MRKIRAIVAFAEVCSYQMLQPVAAYLTHKIRGSLVVQVPQSPPDTPLQRGRIVRCRQQADIVIAFEDQRVDAGQDVADMLGDVANICK